MFYRQVKKKEYPKNYVEKVLSRVPEDDVWVRQFYRQLFYTMEDAMTSHRELAQPAMLNNMEGLLHLDCTLNMKTKKKVSNFYWKISGSQQIRVMSDVMCGWLFGEKYSTW